MNATVHQMPPQSGSNKMSFADLEQVGEERREEGDDCGFHDCDPRIEGRPGR